MPDITTWFCHNCGFTGSMPTGVQHICPSGVQHTCPAPAATAHEVVAWLREATATPNGHYYADVIERRFCQGTGHERVAAPELFAGAEANRTEHGERVISATDRCSNPRCVDGRVDHGFSATTDGRLVTDCPDCQGTGHGRDTFDGGPPVESDRPAVPTADLRERLATMNECVRVYVLMRDRGTPARDGWLEEEVTATDALLNRLDEQTGESKPS